MPTQMLRIGLVGAGRQMREYLLPVLRMMPHVTITHICSKNGQTASELASNWGIPSRTSNWEEMLHSANRPDALVVAADPHVHAMVAEAALIKGVHTYVEKPPAIDVATIRRLSQLEIARPQTVTYVGYNFEQSAQYVTGMSLLRDQTEPSLMTLRFVSSGPRDSGCYGDVLSRVIWDTLIHPLHMAIKALGRPIALSAMLAWLDNPMLAIRLLLEHAEGRQSLIEVGNYADRFDFHIRIVGKTGLTVEVDSLRVIQLRGHKGTFFTEKEIIESSWPIRRSNANCIGYAPSIEKFIESIGASTANGSSFSDSVDTVIALDQISTKLVAASSARVLT